MTAFWCVASIAENSCSSVPRMMRSKYLGIATSTCYPHTKNPFHKRYTCCWHSVEDTLHLLQNSVSRKLLASLVLEQGSQHSRPWLTWQQKTQAINCKHAVSITTCFIPFYGKSMEDNSKVSLGWTVDTLFYQLQWNDEINELPNWRLTSGC